MQLPREPGLYRRLAYGENIRRHSYNRNIDYTHIDNNTGLSLKCLIKNSNIIFENNDFFCSICQDNKHSKVYKSYVKNLTNLSLLRQLNCKHKFHIECIETWLTYNKTCPMCRKNLKT
jgi:hypothetical protein